MIDSTTGKSWSQGGANRMFQHIRHHAIAELRARDATRGVPLTEPVLDEKGEPTGAVRESGKVYHQEGNRFVIDPGLAAAKHNGDDGNALATARWREYRKTPRDEAKELARIVKDRPPVEKADVKRGRQVEEELRSATTQTRPTSKPALSPART